MTARISSSFFLLVIIISNFGCTNSRFRSTAISEKSHSDISSEGIETRAAKPVLNGWIDRIAANQDGSYSITGWACIKGSNRSIPVDLYLGGAAGKGGVYINRTKAAQSSEAAVTQACQATGKNYRFTISINSSVALENSGKVIYVHGITSNKSANLPIGNSGNLKIPKTPTQSSGDTKFSFPSVPQFYSPSMIFENGLYKMWVTAGDRIRYYTSKDGNVWSGGQTVFYAQSGTWEIDGGSFEGYAGGISDPRVIANATPGWKYTMYYTAGAAPNTNTSGGLGVAFSNDGISWVRSTKNPIRRFPGGNAFAVQSLQIENKKYFYFYGGGNMAAGLPPELRVTEDLGDGESFGSDQILPMGSRAYPLAYDASSNTCLFAENVYNADVPQDIQIYSGSNCFTNLGQAVAKIGIAHTGKSYNFGAGIKERDPSGQWNSAKGEIQLIFASGNQWGNWQPASLSLTVNAK